jgi:kinesin family protein C2/C3
MELKGNIRVFCRIRPAKTGGESVSVAPYGDTRSMLTAVDQENPKAKPQNYEYDHVFGPETTNSEVFDEVEPLVTSVLDGYNGCIFAYGQTGSGKTHTMMGSTEQPGVNILALQRLFAETAQCRERKFELSVSLMEVYNETIRDLLTSDEKGKNLDIKSGPLGQHCPDATTQTVRCLDDVLQVIAVGNANRATAATNCNEHSSRSHCILSVYIAGEHCESGDTVTSFLHLVDLAGSERLSRSGAVGDRALEAKNINKSLSALGDVVMALFNKSGHVPYRNSKLTFLLQDALGGNSKTLMMMQVSPSCPDLNESMCTLKFAQRVRGVTVGLASKNTQSGELTKLREEVAKFRHESAAKSSELKEQAAKLKELQSKAGAAKAGEAKVEKELLKQLELKDRQLNKAADENQALNEEKNKLKEKLSNAESQKKEISASTKGEAARYSVLEAKYDKLLKQNKDKTVKAEESSRKGAEASEARHEKLMKQNTELATKCEESAKAAAAAEVKYVQMELQSKQFEGQAQEAAKREEALNAKILELQELQALQQQQVILQNEPGADSPQMSPSDKSFVALFGEKAQTSRGADRRGVSPKRSSAESGGPQESPARKSRRKSSLTPRRHGTNSEEPTSPFVAWADKKEKTALEKSLSIDELAVP